MPRSFVSVATALLVGATAAASQTSRSIAEGVFVLERANQPTIGWIDLGPDVLVVVGGRGPVAPDRLEQIRREANKPIRGVFAPNGRPAPAAGGGATIAPASRGGAGGFGFQGTLTLTGTRSVELREIERAVSAGNGIAFLPGPGVLFAGDLVGDGAAFDSVRTEAWIAVLDRLRRLDPKIVVPGSGPAAGPELLVRTRAGLVAASAHVRQGVAAGQPLERIVASIPAEVGAGGPALVRRIYREQVGLDPPAMIDELELRPGPSPTAKTPGWTKPKAVLVRDLWDNPERLAQLRLVAPGVDIKVARTPEEANAVIGEVDASLGWLSADLIRRGTRLRWVQWPSAGVEGVVAIPGFAESPITLTNAQRIYGPPIAEHVFGLLLGLTRKVQVAVPLMHERRWDQEVFLSREMPELRGKTLLVAGLGGIGTEVARIAHGLGMRVIATRNVAGPPTDLVDYVGGAGDLATLAREADVVVNCLPLTKATERAFDAAVFRGMKPTAYFVNIGRGRTVDTGALLAALDEKRLAGAGLDVTDPEPLPADHRLWTLANVVITPHVASNSDWERERTWYLFRENLRRFAAGEPLLSVVDKKAGY
jgi:phosphoglycerate dehydrogenase-like enzyme